MNNNILNAKSNCFFYIHSDCFITYGVKRCSILDTTNNKTYFVNSEYYEIVLLLRKKRISEIISELDSNESVENFQIFLQFLLKNDLGVFVDDIKLFPEIDKVWDDSSPITNAVVDVDSILHNFSLIFDQLDELRCRFLQIRSFRSLSFEEIETILTKTYLKSFTYIDFIIKQDLSDKYFSYKIKKMSDKFTNAYFTIYNVPFDEVDKLNKEYEKNQIYFIKKTALTCNDCGKINKNTFINHTIQSYMENLLYNGCLNRKISIDVDGLIKNCPSFRTNYGSIENIKLKEVIELKEFKKYWYINKQQISVCKDCELKCVCSDCRAYLTDQSDIYSKPSKCSYNPYTLKW